MTDWLSTMSLSRFQVINQDMPKTNSPKAFMPAIYSSRLNNAKPIMADQYNRCYGGWTPQEDVVDARHRLQSEHATELSIHRRETVKHKYGTHDDLREEMYNLRIKIDELTKDVEVKKDEIFGWKKANYELQSQTVKLKNDVEVKQDEIVGWKKVNYDMHSHTVKLENELAIHKQKHKEDEDYIVELQCDVAKLKKENESLKRKTPRKSESPNAKTESEISKVREELSTEKATSRKYQLELNKVREELSPEKATSQKYQLELNKVTEELSIEKSNSRNYLLESYKVKQELSSENANSQKYQLASEKLLEWKQKCEERETRRMKEYNAVLESEIQNDLRCSKMDTSLFNATEKGKRSLKEHIDRLEILNTTKTEELKTLSHELKQSEENAQTLRDKLSGAENMIRELMEINRRKSLEHKISDMKDEYEQEKRELFENVSISLNKIEDLQTLLNNAQASERNLNTRLKERDQELERLNAFKKGQDSERRGFEAKIAEKEKQLQQANEKHQATRHELENTNRELQEYIQSVNDREQSIKQLQEKISKITNDNTTLKKNLKKISSNLDIASEENIKLQEETQSWKQQLEKAKMQANTDVVEKERQLELRIKEQRNNHLEEVKQIHLKYKDSMKMISDANSREQRAVETAKVLEGKLESLEHKISDMTDEYEHKQQELFENVSVSLNKIEDLQTRLNNAQASERNLNKRIKERDQELERLNAFRKGQDSERRGFEAKLAEKENQLQQANEQLQHFDKERQNLKQELYQAKSKLDELLKNYEASVKGQIQSKDDGSLFRQLDQLKSKEEELAAELVQLRQQLKNSKSELEETNTRLSKLIEQRLTDNKPDITDLSDKNRPTKLAERYSELYDSEWTDAFEDLDKIYKDEQKTIAMLTVIMTEAACFCKNEADEQMENLRKILTLQTTSSASRGQDVPDFPDVPDVINKQLKNSRKIMSEIAGQHIVETYITRLQQLTSDSARDALRVETFLREAVPLCWLMSIHDPPVVFDRLLQHGEKFNTELYRSYTKTGPVVDFPVWPTMFLHEGGPVLYKGVAQGCSLTND